MSSASDRLRSQGKRVAAKASNRSEQGKTERAATKPDARTAPIGKTVKLTPVLNASVTEWQNKTATQLGLARVTFQQFVEAVCNEVLADEELSSRIVTRIDRER